MSKKTVTLPSGATVTFKDPSELKIRDRKKIIKASESETGAMSQATALGDAIIAVMIEEWSFDYIIPSVVPGSLDELSPKDYDFLVNESAEASKYLFPKLADTDENAKDADSPLDNSNV
jgi:sensor c-di-GMP phosphodiesterase-like protein